VPAILHEVYCGFAKEHKVRPKQTVKNPPTVSLQSVQPSTTNINIGYDPIAVSELGGLWSLSGNVAAISAAKSALKSMGMHARDDFSSLYNDHQDAPNDIEADDGKHQDCYDGTNSLNTLIGADEDSVSSSSSEEDDDDDESFVVVQPRVRNGPPTHTHDNMPAVSTKEQKIETARKLSCLYKELATTKTFVQQTDYKA
jgi:hypothetical protein